MLHASSADEVTVQMLSMNKIFSLSHTSAEADLRMLSLITDVGPAICRESTVLNINDVFSVGEFDKREFAGHLKLIGAERSIAGVRILLVL